VALDSATRNGSIILTSTDKRPRTPDGFRASFRKGRIKAGVLGVTFNDLRATAVTRLAIAGCTEAEIATITGHSLRDVRWIPDAHYLHRDPTLAENEIKKLERGIESTDQRQK
jgi:integrase